MGGKVKNKNSDNFEKIKREMAAKRQKAILKSKKSVDEISIQSVVEDEAQSIEQISTKVNKAEIQNADKVLQPSNKVSMNEAIKDSSENEKEKSFQQDKKIKFVIFHIGEEEFALSVFDVKEIIRIPSAMVQVPNAPSYIAGLCALRGELLPVIDSRKLFNITEKEKNSNNRILITDINGKKVGLITDRVSEVITVDETVVKQPPLSMKGIDNEVINAIMLLDEGKRVIIILDAFKIMKATAIKDASNKNGILEENIQDIKSKEEQIIIFSVGNEEYCFPIDNVQEIIRIPEITKVPDTSEYIEGVISIRNQLLVIVNLGKLLGNNKTVLGKDSRVMIINTEHLTFGIIIDKVSRVMRVSKDLFKSSSLNKCGTADTDYIKGFYNLDNGKRLVIMLESEKMIESENINAMFDLDIKKGSEKPIQNDSHIQNREDQIVIFQVDNEEYGLSVNNVKEINRMGEMTRFPGAPTFIDGMTDLRDEVIPVLNLRKLFGLKSDNNYYSSKLLVVEYKQMTIGIIVDSASEVIKFSKHSVEKLSNSMEENNENGYVNSVLKSNKGKRMVLLLNLNSVMSFL